MKRWRFTFDPVALALAAGLLVAAPANADDGDERPGSFAVQVENDLFGDGRDQYYTQGLQLTFLPKEKWEPEWFKHGIEMIPGIDPGDETTFVMALGQQMFTPEDTSVSDPDPTDRPYAGWLFASIGAVVEKPDSNLLQNVSLDLGIVGPASLGGYTQRRWHALIGVDQPRGWGKQLNNEPGVLLTYQARLRRELMSAADVVEVDFLPSAGVALGNVLTQGSVGAALRLGHNLGLTYGPPFIRPSLPAAAITRRKGGFGWNLFAGFEGRAVGRNIFLDGNTLGDSRSVEKKNLVIDFQGGVEVVLGSARVSFTQVLRTREFDGQKRKSQFGSIAVSILF